MKINGVEYEWANINTVCFGEEIKGIKSIRYDEFKPIVEYAKLNGIELLYGASSEVPISISMPTHLEVDEFLFIDLKNVPRSSWFKY